MNDNTIMEWLIKSTKIRMIKESCDKYKAWRWAMSRRVCELESYILKNQEILIGEKSE